MSGVPITLTRQQFLATPAGRQPGATYEGYLGYVAKARATRLGAAPADPYDPIIAGLASTPSDASYIKQAQGQVSPLVAAASKTITGQTKAATHAIAGYSADAAAKLAGLDFGAPYTAGEGDQAAVDAALRQSLAGAGSADADALSARLGVINDPSVATAASSLTANGAANGNTQLAQGSAALSNLIANAAAAKEYGSKLPGIEKLAGLQDISSAQQAGVSKLADVSQQYESQIPSIVQGLKSEHDSRAHDVASAEMNKVARQDAFATTDANNAAKVSVAKIAALTKASEDEVRQAQSDREYGLQFARTYHFDPATGRPLAGYTIDGKTGNVVKITKPPLTKPVKPTPDYPNLTKSQVVHLRAGVSSAFYGVPAQKDVNGKVVRNALPPVDYWGAVTEAVKAGYSRAAAIKMANRFYMPGQRGRPQKTAP